jgi:quinol monooxygenase YgiN
MLAGSAALALVPLLAPAARGQADLHPIAAQVKAQLKDPAKPFLLVVRLQVKEGMGQKFEAAFAKAQKETRKEKGCGAYDLSRDIKEPTRYLVYERWKSLADLDTHLKSPYITTLLGELGELLNGGPDLSVMVPVGD